MIVAPLVYDALLCGSLASAIGAIAVFFVRDGRPKLPTATVHGGPSRAVRRATSRFAPWLALVGGAVAAIWVYTQSHALVIVSDDGGRISARRAVQLGAWSGDDDPIDTVWVVNRATRAVRVEIVQYGFPLGERPPAFVAPGSTRGFDGIDHIGPDDPPPNEIREAAVVPIDSRNWLTWD